MGITKLSKSGFKSSSYEKYNDFLAGNTAYSPFAPASYESIATVTVGSGGASEINFTSIPSTYTHLQVRGIQLTSGGNWGLRLQVNSDTGNNYATHRVGSFGTGTFADSAANNSFINIGLAGTVTSTFGGTVVDILDYANTNKFKTVRSLNGFNENGSGYVIFNSGLWRNTNAITSLKFLLQSSGTFIQYSQFALYGVKG